MQEAQKTLKKNNRPQTRSFLQSFEWGKFQEATGKKIYQNEIGQFIEMPLPLGKKYLYLVGGSKGDIDKIGEVGKKLGAVFVRFEPEERSFPFDFAQGQDDVIVKVRDVQPANSLVLDLSKTEEELLAGMHSKTRYNVRLAKKKGVRIAFSLQPSAFRDEIWELFKETGKRGEFGLHPRSYYEKMFEILNTGSCRVFLATAEYEGEVIAANIMLDYQDTRIYLHGASSNKHREVMSPYLLHWEMIKDAKKKGLKKYDWWGIAPADKPKHPWAGVTRFKKGFGGDEVHYPGTYELVIDSFWYRIYFLAKKIIP